MLNQRMEYWRQERLKEACEFCPHRKPNIQTTYEGRSLGRTPFMNIGATYDGDFGNEIVLSNVQFNGFDSEDNKEETDKYEYYYYKADGGDEGENKGGVGDEDEDEDDDDDDDDDDEGGIGDDEDSDDDEDDKVDEGHNEKYKPWKFCNGSMTFTIREPVMVEPLPYQTIRGCNKTMNNIDNIDLEYNFNNLRDMIQFNCAKL